MKLSIVLLVASLICGIGGWAVTLPSWTAAVTPVSIGGLLMVLGGVIAAWIGKSPIKVNGTETK